MTIISSLLVLISLIYSVVVNRLNTAMFYIWKICVISVVVLHSDGFLEGLIFTLVLTPAFIIYKVFSEDQKETMSFNAQGDSLKQVICVSAIAILYSASLLLIIDSAQDLDNLYADKQLATKNIYLFMDEYHYLSVFVAGAVVVFYTLVVEKIKLKKNNE